VADDARPPLASRPVSLRTYRVVVRGFSDGLDETQRSRLRERLADHDLFDAAFTADGTLAYDAALSASSHRVVVQVAGGPTEEEDAHTAGQLSAMARLEGMGVAWRRLRSTATCTDDVRVRRR
jgi:uncharacterized protein DUF6204